MNPAFFGRYAWDFYHQIPYIVVGKTKSKPEILEIGLDNEDKGKTTEFFENFSKILACIVCIIHAEENKKQVQEDLQNIQTVGDAVKVFVKFHNIVNESLKKPTKDDNDVPIIPTKSWIYSMFMLFFCSLWTYDFLELEGKNDIFVHFYEKTMPKVIFKSWPKIAHEWESYVEQNSLKDALQESSRQERIKWVVGLRNHLKSWCGDKELCWECDDISMIMKLHEGQSMRESAK